MNRNVGKLLDQIVPLRHTTDSKIIQERMIQQPNARSEQVLKKKTGLEKHTRVYPKVSDLVAWRENCKYYSSLPLAAVVSLFCDSV
jgi:hypothetical protein